MERIVSAPDPNQPSTDHFHVILEVIRVGVGLGVGPRRWRECAKYGLASMGRQIPLIMVALL